MNNSKIALDNIETEEEIDLSPVLREQETKVVKIIEAISVIAVSEQWKVLKELIFDDLVDSLERRISSEAKRKPIDEPEIYALTGQLAWAKRYADFNKLADAYKLELSNLRKKLNATN